MAHRKFATRPHGVSVFPDVGGRGGAGLRHRRALAPVVLGAARGGAGRQGHGEDLARLPVTTIQGRNGIFSLCDEESAATCCVGAPPHKHSKEFRPVPSIASTIEHIGESRLGPRDQSCIRPAIGTQTPWHDIRWLRLSLGTSEIISCSHLQKVAGGSFTDQDDAIGRQFLRG